MHALEKRALILIVGIYVAGLAFWSLKATTGYQIAALPPTREFDPSTPHREKVAQEVVQGEVAQVDANPASPQDLAHTPAGITQETGKPLKSAKKSKVPPAPVAVNRASEEQLQSLPGIGPSIAKKILLHRKQHGSFENAEDLLAVPGIGPKKLNSLRAYVRFDR